MTSPYRSRSLSERELQAEQRRSANRLTAKQQAKQQAASQRGGLAQQRREQQRQLALARMAVPVTRVLPEAAVLAAQDAPPPSKQLLDFADLKALGVPWGRSRLYRVMAQGRFPRPVSTGPNWYDRKVWRRRDVERWLRSLTPAADYATPAE